MTLFRFVLGICFSTIIGTRIWEERKQKKGDEGETIEKDTE
jgi:hypothetical protein